MDVHIAFIIASISMVGVITWLYRGSIKRSTSIPSLWMWSALLLRSCVDWAVYADLTSWTLSAPKLATIVGLLPIISITYRVVGMDKLGKNDRRTMYVSFVALIFWPLFGPIWGNIIVLCGMLLAFWPKYKGLYRCQTGEHPVPWLCASSVNVLLGFAVYLNPIEQSSWAYLGPVAGTAMGVAVVVLELRRRRMEMKARP